MAGLFSFILLLAAIIAAFLGYHYERRIAQFTLFGITSKLTLYCLRAFILALILGLLIAAMAVL